MMQVNNIVVKLYGAGRSVSSSHVFSCSGSAFLVVMEHEDSPSQ